MKSITTLLFGLLLSSTTWAACPETSLTQDIRDFDLSGKMKIIELADNKITYTDALTYKPGSEEYEYINSEMNSDFKLLSDVYIDQILPFGYFFVQDNKTCKNSLMIDDGDEGSLYFVNSIHKNRIYTTEEYSNKQFVFEKSSLN